MLHTFIHNFIHLFIPHEGNDYRPRLLQRVGMVGLFGLVVLSFTAANMQALLWQTSDYLVGAVLPAVVVDLTNKERKTLSLPPVSRNAVLDAAAQLKADDMAKNSYFSHESPTGVTPWHWFEVAGYPFVHAGENLAVYFTDSDEVVDAWMKSPTHRANIVNSQYREIGIGTARGVYKGYETVFVVQLFGARALPAVAVVTNPPAVVANNNLPPATAAPLAAAPLLTETVPNAERERLLTLAPLPTATGEPLVAGEAIDTEPVTLVAVANPSRSDGVNDYKAASDTTAVVNTTSTPVAEPEPVPMEIPERVIVPGIADSVPAMYLNTAASSTNLAPAPMATIEYSGGTSAPMVARLATEPNRVLQLLYIIVGLITGIALGTSVLLQWRQHRPVQTVYGIAMLILMCGLFYVHTMVTSGVVIQ